MHNMWKVILFIYRYTYIWSVRLWRFKERMTVYAAQACEKNSIFYKTATKTP